MIYWLALPIAYFLWKVGTIYFILNYFILGTLSRKSSESRNLNREVHGWSIYAMSICIMQWYRYMSDYAMVYVWLCNGIYLISLPDILRVYAQKTDNCFPTPVVTCSVFKNCFYVLYIFYIMLYDHRTISFAYQN